VFKFVSDSVTKVADSDMINRNIENGKMQVGFCSPTF
jgi:hypothetical protein